jgi:hypothetical protein
VSSLNLDIKPRHIQRGVAASNESKARQRRLDDIDPPPMAPEPAGAPFKPSPEAMFDLARALGYDCQNRDPEGGWRHWLRDDADLESVLPPRRARAADAKKPGVRPGSTPRGAVLRGAGPTAERLCKSCEKWKPDSQAFFRMRGDGSRHVSNECLRCESERRSRSYRELRERRKVAA